MNKLSTRFASTALLLLPAAAFAQMTGVSHPEDLNDTITVAPAQTSHYVKPSPAVQMTATPEQSPVQTYASPVPVQRGAGTDGDIASDTSSAPDGAPLSHAQLVRRDHQLEGTSDPDSSIVVEVASARNELPAGTLMHVELTHEVSTVTTQPGDDFSARLTQPMLRRGEVLVPAGSVLTGRIANVHGGNPLHGGPVIHLYPEFLTLPDGEKHRISAQVIDLPYVEDARVNEEGVIHGKLNLKGAAAGLGLTTASTTVAGAVVGGGVGAAVGAAVGVGVATVWYLRHEQEQTLPERTEVVFSLDEALRVGPIGQ